MRICHISYIASLCIAACTFIVALPVRAWDAAMRFILPETGAVERIVADLLRGPALAIDGPSTSIDASLLHRQRHEAGLARLGAVRHR